MTQEDKQILLRDLCSRLPYDTWVKYEGKEWLVTGYGHGRVSLLPSVFSSIGGPCPLLEEVRPYLRPMSSMTEKEKRKYDILVEEIVYRPGVLTCSSLIDFCHEHHLDGLGLIEKGLALEAPEGMYETE